jgi:hypothetical protein
MSVKPRVAIASNDECLTRGPNVRFDVSNEGLIPRRLVLALFIVCIGFSFLRFGFLVFGYSGVSIFLPVHVRKRGDRLKPATTAQFFSIASCCAAKIPRS